VNLKTGRRDTAREILRNDRAGIVGRLAMLQIRPDGAYAYSVWQRLGELQVVTGLR
jgi:hypothetical protein